MKMFRAAGLVAVFSTVFGCLGPEPGEADPRLAADMAEWLSLEALAERGGIGDVAVSDLGPARAVTIDPLGEAHTRVPQSFREVPVFAGEVVVHLRPDGSLKGFTDGLIHDVSVTTTPVLTMEQAVEVAVQHTGGWAAQSKLPKADLQILKAGRSARLTWRVRLESLGSSTPSMPVVFVGAEKGEVVWSYDNLQTARDRRLHNLNHGTALPGPLARSEGQAPSGDIDVDTNYTRVGSTYDCYSALFGRDSFNNAGAPIISSVHFATNFVNAFWTGSQMAYGDGDNVISRSLALSMDVTAHELTHAVTQYTSNLVYSGESGGLNEAMSDIFGNVCEWHRDTGGDVTLPASANTWMVGEEIWLAAPALRYMDDPARDGISLDFWTSSAGSVDVHYSSGIANLAFYLLSQGGKHPRGKSSRVVTGIGVHDAARIFYRANTVYLVPTSGFAAARAATVSSAVDLFGAGSVQAVQAGNAWTAVGVAGPPPGVSNLVITSARVIYIFRIAMTVSISAQWEVAPQNDFDVAGYVVDYCLGPETCVPSIRHATTFSSPPALLVLIATGGGVGLKVMAVSSSGVLGPPSNTVHVTWPPVRL